MAEAGKAEKKIYVCPKCSDKKVFETPMMECPLCGSKLLNACPVCKTVLADDGDATECKACGSRLIA